MKHAESIPGDDHIRQAVKAYTPHPQEGDWEAMSRLLDEKDAGLAAPPDPYPVPGPSLPPGWGRFLIGGWLLGALLLTAFALSTPDRPSPLPFPSTPDSLSSPPAPAPPTAIQPPADEVIPVALTNLPAAPTSNRTNTVSAKDIPTITNESALLPTHNEQGAGLAATPLEKGLRPASIRLEELPESFYNVGLMAVSRLRRAPSPVVLENAFPKISQVVNHPAKSSKISLGIYAGVLVPFQPVPDRVSLFPHGGLMVTGNRKGGWFWQAGLGAKWRTRARYAESLGTSSLPDQFFGETEKYSRGILLLEAPVLAGRVWKNWQLAGGVNMMYALPESVSDRLEKEFVAETSNPASGDVTGISRHWIPGLSAMVRYRFTSRIGLDLRYNQALLPLVDASPNKRYEAVHPTDLMLSVSWWW